MTAEERYCTEHSDEPCPALDPETGRCDLYEWRPLACRTMGPPVRIGGTDPPPWPFCFAAVPPVELERCRATPDPEGREDALVEERERRPGFRGETLIAFAIAGRPARRRAPERGDGWPPGCWRGHPSADAAKGR